MRLRLLATTLLAVFALSGVARADTPAPAPKWEQFDEEDGIRMFRRDVPGSSIVGLRGEGFIAAPIARVASVLIDRKRSVEWIDRLVKTKVIRELSETEAINWNHIKTPSPLKDRDFVFKTMLSTEPAKKKVLFSYYSVQDSRAPEYDAYVRGSFQSGKFELTMAERTNSDGSKTWGTVVVAEVVVDPKGSVPTFIVNMVQKSWPHKTLSALRNQVAKPDIKDDPRVLERLKREGFIQ
jgi:START domain-containing protein